MLLNCFLTPEAMRVGQRFLKRAIPWFIGVGLRYWTLCNSTHGPTGVLGYWQVTGVSLCFIPLSIRYFNWGDNWCRKAEEQATGYWGLPTWIFVNG